MVITAIAFQPLGGKKIYIFWYLSYQKNIKKICWLLAIGRKLDYSPHLCLVEKVLFYISSSTMIWFIGQGEWGDGIFFSVPMLSSRIQSPELPLYLRGSVEEGLRRFYRGGGFGWIQIQLELWCFCSWYFNQALWSSFPDSHKPRQLFKQRVKRLVPQVRKNWDFSLC